MKKIQYRFEVEKLNHPVFGYDYNVQVFTSRDFGRTFWYCGTGKFCRTEEEALAYVERFKRDHDRES